jgi:hypothetical protein
VSAIIMKLSAIIAVACAIYITWAGYQIAGMVDTIETQQHKIIGLEDENSQLLTQLVEARMGGWPHEVKR